eukprot:m.9405 g.9405  ORF g.9405 m.9405 type:complete len:392 (-) comp4059_c0_seq2:94-1269(-)
MARYKKSTYRQDFERADNEAILELYKQLRTCREARRERENSHMIFAWDSEEEISIDLPQIQLVLENHKENGNDEETDYPISKVLQSKETIEEEAKEDIESNSLDNDDQHHKDSGDEGEVENTQEEEKVVEVPEIEQNDQFNLEEPENIPEDLPKAKAPARQRQKIVRREYPLQDRNGEPNKSSAPKKKSKRKPPFAMYGWAVDKDGFYCPKKETFNVRCNAATEIKKHARAQSVRKRTNLVKKKKNVSSEPRAKQISFGRTTTVVDKKQSRSTQKSTKDKDDCVSVSSHTVGTQTDDNNIPQKQTSPLRNKILQQQKQVAVKVVPSPRYRRYAIKTNWSTEYRENYQGTRSNAYVRCAGAGGILGAHKPAGPHVLVPASPQRSDLRYKAWK